LKVFPPNRGVDFYFEFLSTLRWTVDGGRWTVDVDGGRHDVFVFTSGIAGPIASTNQY
jgi:hypothetical protein